MGQVAAHLDDVIVFDSDLTAHVNIMGTLFERLRKHNLKLSPSKARLGVTDVDFLGHSISPAGVNPNAENISALIKMPTLRDLKQVQALLGGVGYYRKFLRGLSKRIRPMTFLLRKGVKFEFTPAMGVIVHEISRRACRTNFGLPRLGRRGRRLPPLPRVLRRVHLRLQSCA